MENCGVSRTSKTFDATGHKSIVDKSGDILSWSFTSSALSSPVTYFGHQLSDIRENNPDRIKSHLKYNSTTQTTLIPYFLSVF